METSSVSVANLRNSPCISQSSDTTAASVRTRDRILSTANAADVELGMLKPTLRPPLQSRSCTRDKGLTLDKMLSTALYSEAMSGARLGMCKVTGVRILPVPCSRATQEYCTPYIQLGEHDDSGVHNCKRIMGWFLCFACRRAHSVSMSRNDGDKIPFF